MGEHSIRGFAERQYHHVRAWLRLSSGSLPVQTSEGRQEDHDIVFSICVGSLRCIGVAIFFWLQVCVFYFCEPLRRPSWNWSLYYLYLFIGSFLGILTNVLMLSSFCISWSNFFLAGMLAQREMYRVAAQDTAPRSSFRLDESELTYPLWLWFDVKFHSFGFGRESG